MFLTSNVAKPAVAFGGKYRIIDFPLSNCINSGVDTVGVLTQYQPFAAEQHISALVFRGIWTVMHGGVTLLPPYEKSESSDWYTGTANAIYQNMEYIEKYNPEYVLILGGDHIYKMDYEVMLDYHKANKGRCDNCLHACTYGQRHSRFGVVITDDNGNIKDFEEKPPNVRAATLRLWVFISLAGRY